MPKKPCPICSTGGECLQCDGCDAHEHEPCKPWCEHYEDGRYEIGPEVPSPFEDPVLPGW
ncbi:hypothetical protein AQJ11_02950 [Streptomyces corchorusii]|uniref:Uncharacterized protein n=2 Tax=Streptomyces TaxID=1883 RepID=A0A101QM76_STRCK|nr:hypothetical protein [Streptomyces corchorusii]KUN32500.1 hypothetical protein AQJ11_02950 [Streptomyces corchorusii]